MIQLSAVKTLATSTLGRAGLLISKRSPEILMGVGIVGAVASTVLACRATLKVDCIVKESDESFRRVHKAKEELPEKVYSNEDYKRDLTIVTVKRTVSILKLYAPSAIMGVISVGLIVGSHRILTKRNAALMAAYKAIDEGFSHYRKQVVAEFGEEKDKELRYGAVVKNMEEAKAKAETLSEDNKGLAIKNQADSRVPPWYSEYARFFDEYSPEWKRDPELNLFYLRQQEIWANQKLNANGVVFLNEVYESLGIPRSQAGCLVGWVKDSPNGDGHIDFGIYNPENGGARTFVNGYESAILLDFNVDGPVYDSL